MENNSEYPKIGQTNFFGDFSATGSALKEAPKDRVPLSLEDLLLKKQLLLWDKESDAEKQ